MNISALDEIANVELYKVRYIGIIYLVYVQVARLGS